MDMLVGWCKQKSLLSIGRKVTNLRAPQMKIEASNIEDVRIHCLLKAIANIKGAVVGINGRVIISTGKPKKQRK
jgi:hypothetical protein